MIENVVLACASVLLSAFIVFFSMHRAAEAREREKELLKIIQRLENRIHAGDVNTYRRMEKEDREGEESAEDKKARLEAEKLEQAVEAGRYYSGNGHF